MVIRPVRPDDLERAIDFSERLSARSRYLRFLSPRRQTPEEIRRFTLIDVRREAAVVGIAGLGGEEHQVGVARFVHIPASLDAEFAIVVADEWQGCGLGRRLLEALIGTARQHGRRSLVGTTLSENRAMLSLAGRLGFKSRPDPLGATHKLLSLDLGAGGVQ